MSAGTRSSSSRQFPAPSKTFFHAAAPAFFLATVHEVEEDPVKLWVAAGFAGGVFAGLMVPAGQALVDTGAQAGVIAPWRSSH